MAARSGPLAGGDLVTVRADATSPRSASATYTYVVAPAPLRFGPVHTRRAVLGAGLSCASASLCASIGAAYRCMTAPGTRWRYVTQGP